MSRATDIALEFADQIDAKFRAQNGRDGYPTDPIAVLPGKVYDRIVKQYASGGLSAHAFVDRKTGALYKAASWAAPAKDRTGKPDMRYDLSTPEGLATAVHNADQFGAYLYADYAVQELPA